VEVVVELLVLMLGLTVNDLLLRRIMNVEGT
jgi:hypothetical protein